jgi:ligand-binding sensor domain-containing protein
MSSCSEKEAGEVLFENLLEGKEVSDIVLFKGSVYASGMEGVYRINPHTMEVETLDLGRIYMAKDMVVDDDLLYIGHDGGIIAFDGDNFESILDQTYDVPDYRVNTMMVDSEGILWAGTYDGVLIRVDGQWKSITTDDGLAFKIVFLIMEDGNGGLVFGHYGSGKDGISYLRNGQWSYFTIEDGLPHNYITAGIRKEGLIYLSTGFYDVGGLAIFTVTSDGIRLDRVIERKWGKYGSKTRSINLDNDYLWIGTEYNGICIMKGEEFVKLDVLDGLVNNEVKSILFDYEDRVWLATRKGVSVATKKELYDVFKSRK